MTGGVVDGPSVPVGPVAGEAAGERWLRVLRSAGVMTAAAVATVVFWPRPGGSGVVIPEEIMLGHVGDADLVVVAFTVRNETSEPLRVLGGQLSCGCDFLSNLPVTVPPESGETVTVHAPVADATFDYRLTLYTDRGGVHPIVRMVGSRTLRPIPVSVRSDAASQNL